MVLKKLALVITALMCMSFILTGCGGKTPSDSEASGYTFTDELGYNVTVDMPQKIAICSGSLAEIWLLAGGELCAVTADAYDDHLFEVPETAVNIGKMKSPSVEQMIDLGIDFAVLSSEIAEHTALCDTLEKAGITTAYFKVSEFDEYLSVLKKFTDITGRGDLYQKNGADVQARIEKVIASVSGREAPTVLYLRTSSSAVHAKDSSSLAGAMLKDLGCVNIADSGTLTDELSLEVIVKSDPDFIFVTFMGADEEKAMQVLEDTLLTNPAWSELSAVKNGRFVILPKALFHYKPNAKWGEAYQQLADILYG
ncbi:MAG: ABC transporter substrate-binding protein [Oscillospiraceae bacterium]